MRSGDRHRWRYPIDGTYPGHSVEQRLGVRGWAPCSDETYRSTGDLSSTRKCRDIGYYPDAATEARIAMLSTENSQGSVPAPSVAAHVELVPGAEGKA